jgi:hypothetical protein
MLRSVTDEIRRALAHPRAPLIVFGVILVYALGARMFYLGEPCAAPCNGDSAHGLIFDEAYYVNAARVIDGIHPPAGAPYAKAPLYKDPNAEHPQLAKLIMAGGIELFGNNPYGWRMGSVIFGMVALVAMYFLATGVGAGPWFAVGATGVMALDNLMMIHSRIGTLDIYYVAMALVAAAFYVRGRPVLSGLALGIGACMKLVALGALPAFLLFEAFVVLWARGGSPGVLRTLRARAIPLALTIGVSIATVILGVWLMDVLVPGYDPGTHITYAGNPFTHISHMLTYAAQLKAVSNATGISSGPWQWLLDKNPIDYYRVAINSVSGGKVVASRATFAAVGEINPFIIFLAIPALGAALAAAWYERDRVAALGAAWCIGTFAPLLFEAEVLDRISYLYYMLIVMPGIYLIVARMMSPRRVPRAATVGWVIALVYGFFNLYPVKSLSGH